MKTHSALKILKTAIVIQHRLEQEGMSADCVEAIHDFVLELCDTLEGHKEPPPNKETLLVPGFGFVPVVGTIGAGGKITFFNQGQNKAGGGQ